MSLKCDLKMESCFSHENHWLEVQMAICREGLVGQGQLLADFDFDLQHDAEELAGMIKHG